MSAFLVILLSSVFFFVQGITNLMFISYFISVIPVHSQVVSFPCQTFCPEVSGIYHCVITSALARRDVSGSVSDTTSYSAVDPVGRIRSVGSSFIANKTGSTSFSLNFNAEAQFNNSVGVTCIDLADANSNTNSRQCTIELEGMRRK